MGSKRRAKENVVLVPGARHIKQPLRKLSILLEGIEHVRRWNGQQSTGVDGNP